MYLYYRIRELKRHLDTLPDESKAMFDLTRLVLEEKPNSDTVLLPLKEKLMVFKNREEGIQHLKTIVSLNDNELLSTFLPLIGDDFDLIQGNYTKNDTIANLDKFKFDSSIGKMIFDNSRLIDKRPIRYCCEETVGDNEDRIADAYKMIEFLLLWITNKLADDQKQQIINKLSVVDTSRNLVVTRKYNNVIDFVSTFLEREKIVRKILDRKYDDGGK